MSDTLTREQMAAKLGVPEHQLDYSPNAPRLNRKMRRKLAKLARGKGSSK
jgi:hypothetical protein